LGPIASQEFFKCINLSQGMDFADALHFGSIGNCEAMMTFDRRFIKAAGTGGADEVREP